MNVTLNRQPLGMEDLAIGTGTQTQTRGGQSVTITEINVGVLPYEDGVTFSEIIAQISVWSTTAEGARDAAIAAQGLSEDARDAAIAAQGLSEDARDASQIAQGLSEDARDAAQVAQLAAEAIYDAFDDRYLGSFTTDPTLDNDGNPLLNGSIYFNSSANILKVYDLDSTTWVSIPQVMLSALIDVELTSITTGDILVWNGTKWTNTTDLVLSSLQLSGGTGTQGTLSWNADEETVDLILNGATLQLGQETHIHCRNNTASIIPNGTVVMATGTIGASGRITIAPYDNISDVKLILGVTTETIGVGEDGKVTNFGKVRGLNTSAFSEGQVLYTTVGGGLTATEPTTGIKNPLAFVITTHATVGTIMVRATALDENAYQPFDALYNTYTTTEKTTVNKIDNTAVTSITFNSDGTMTVVVP